MTKSSCYIGLNKSLELTSPVSFFFTFLMWLPKALKLQVWLTYFSWTVLF